MRYRPTFYDRRTKHRFVNAERASSEEELTSDSFIADDEDDDGDEAAPHVGQESENARAQREAIKCVLAPQARASLFLFQRVRAGHACLHA